MRNRILATTLATATLFGLSGFMTLASAEPVGPSIATAGVNADRPDPVDDQAGGELRAGFTNGFTITNLSHHTFEFSANGLTEGDGYPADGTILRPGASLHLDTVWLWGKVHGPFVTLTSIDKDDYSTPQASFHARFVVSSKFADREATIRNVTQSGLEVRTNGTSVTLLDPANTVVDLPADHADDLVKTVKEFCGKAGAECKFVPTIKPFDVWKPREVVGNPVVNTTDETHATSYGTNHHVGDNHSAGGELSFEGQIKGLVTVAVKGTYNHDWINEWDFSQTVDVTLAPETVTWVTATEPMRRITGDFVVRYHNITWTLRNIHFDEPQIHGTRYLQISSRKLTPEELEAARRTGEGILHSHNLDVDTTAPGRPVATQDVTADHLLG